MKFKEKLAMEYCRPRRGQRGQYRNIILEAYKVGFEKAREMATKRIYTAGYPGCAIEIQELGEEEVQ